MVQVTFSLAVTEHRIEPKFLKNEVAFAVPTADDAGNRFGNCLRGGLDEFRPAIDAIMHFIQIPVPASRLHRHHSFEFPVILSGEPDALPVCDGPENGGIDGTAKVCVQFGSWDLGRLRHIRFYFGSAVRTLARAVNAAVPATARTATAAICGGGPLRTAVGHARQHPNPAERPQQSRSTRSFQSRAMVSRRGRSSGLRATNKRVPQIPASAPATPPRNPSKLPSAKFARTTEGLLAPSAPYCEFLFSLSHSCEP